jgi:inorganic pyrophosphatase
MPEIADMAVPPADNDGHADFFTILDRLAASAEIVVDRPKGLPHPRIPDAIYPLDYGYLQGVTGGDGDGLDVFIGSAKGRGVVGVLLTADPVKRDDDEVRMVQTFLAESLGIGGHAVPRPSRD